MKVFIIISLFFISVLSLFSYNKIEFARDIDDYRIYGPLDNSGLSMLNDSIAVLYYHTVDDTAKVLDSHNGLGGYSPAAIANYNINTKTVEFYYNKISSDIRKWSYRPAFLTKDKSKVFAFGTFYNAEVEFEGGRIDDYSYFDSVEVFNTSNGQIDTVFRIEGYHFTNFSNMYNGNISFMAVKENDSLYYKNEFYVGEINPDTYSYTLTRTPLYFGTIEYKEFITNYRIVKSYRPNIDEEVWFETIHSIPGINGEDQTFYETYSFVLDDSLQYRKKKQEQYLWWSTGGLPSTLNHDSIYTFGGGYGDAYDVDLGNSSGYIPKFTIGVDENNKYFISEGWIKDSLPVVYFYYKIYDYQNGVTIDSVFTDNPLEHPLFQDVGGTNFNISNDSIGIVIFKGSIWKFRLFSSTSGIDSNENDPELIKNIYPNPTLSTLNVEFNKELSYNDINKIKIIDVTGKSLNTNITYENSNIISINMENFSPGSYIFNYKSNSRLINIVR